jgi:CheY-like chemotaxis protein
MSVDNSPGKTVLVAEDNDDVRTLLKVYLEQHQFNVLEAENGEEAIEIARTRKPDLILMDLSMPDVGGIQAIKEIRQDADLAGIPILVNSAYGNLGIDLYLNIDDFGEGYIEYLPKPLNYYELPNIIKKVLDEAPANSDS